MAQIEIIGNLGADITRFPPALRGGQAPSVALPSWGGLLPWQIKRVRDYVDENLGDRLSLGGAAQRVRLSPGYFSRCFRQSFGLSFSRFVAQRRIATAKAMMTGSTSSLCQIALACGFTDQSHFTRTFGGMTGSTPARWRRAAIRSNGQTGTIGSC